MRKRVAWLLAPIGIVWQIHAATPVLAAKADVNHFATVFVDGEKVREVHFTVQYGETDEVEELKTRASMSVLGTEIFHFTQHLHEEWDAGELQSTRGETDDDGDKYTASLDRTPDGYQGELNDQPLTLPDDAFPASPWHYAITEKALLFDLKDLRLLKVEVAAAEGSLASAGEEIASTRFDFSGDWQASIWFDRNKQLVKLAYRVEGHDVVVTIDPN